MTREEELTYLFGILSEASKWSASSDDPRDLVRMEVEERVANLIRGVTPEPDENGLIQSSIHPDNPKTVIRLGQFVDKVEEPLNEDDYKALEAERLAEHLANRSNAKRKWAKNRVRVIIDGKPTWKLRSECHKEVMPGWTTKLHWVWDGASSPTVGENLPTKAEQCDAMWAEHDRG